MELERTFVFLKPEAVMRGLIGEIVSRIEKKGLTIVAMKLAEMSRTQAEKLYEMHRGKPFYEALVERVSGEPVLLMVVEGPRAVQAMRSLIGATDPIEAKPGTIRGDYALLIGRNIIHAADSPENAEREIKIFFKEEEILKYRRPAEESYLYRE